MLRKERQEVTTAVTCYSKCGDLISKLNGDESSIFLRGYGNTVHEGEMHSII
jgi:hypothetical protein